MDLPEVLQCTVEGSNLFGAVAVKQSENRWAYTHPEHGGGWVSLIEVQGWTPMQLVSET